jgi:hypothetical protein
MKRMGKNEPKEHRSLHTFDTIVTILRNSCVISKLEEKKHERKI